MARVNLFPRSSSISFLGGIVIIASLLALIPLPSLRGTSTPTFLVLFTLASVGYLLAVLRLKHEHIPIKWIFVFGIIFRLALLFTSPSLSDDVYRYVWDGHLLNEGVNPYAYPVNSPTLDPYSIQIRNLVNHDWMASPYMPFSQLVFGLVEFLISQNILAFQVTAVLFDLATGWFVLDILRRLGLPGRNVLIYLWNPLIIIEFAHSAHIDALMICLMMFAFWLWLKTAGASKRLLSLSILALAAAALTKFLPVLLAPIFLPRWGWKRGLIFISVLAITFGIFIPGAGLGIFGPMDGTGVFGALRIYLQSWNYNSGLYHWLEVLLSGYSTSGSVPVEIVGETPIIIAKAITASLLGSVVLLTGWLALRIERSKPMAQKEQNLALIRLGLLPLGAYLLFAATIHPWYVTLVIPFLPFLFSEEGECPRCKAFMWPWIYFSIAVTLSYLTYLDPDNLRETSWVRLVEYIPLYGLLGWAFWRGFRSRKRSKTGRTNYG